MELKDIFRIHRDELKERGHNANKGSYGRLLMAAGSRGMAGAAYLGGLAALRCGIGMVKYIGPEDNRPILQILLPEAMYESDCGLLKESLEWADYLIAGPGISKNGAAKDLVRKLFSEDLRHVIQDKKAVIIDADALNIIAEDGLELKRLSSLPAGTGNEPLRDDKTKEEAASQSVSPQTGSDSGTKRAFSSNIVITPHIVEMLRLLKNEYPGITVSDIKNDPGTIASEYSIKHNVLVVLKDAVTTVAEGGRVFTIGCGCGAMAKAGSGDVLCGFIAGTAAIFKGNLPDAVPAAVCLHGRAGCIASAGTGPHSMLAHDMANAAGEAIKDMMNAEESI